ncbi:MAG: UTRA domain-containing protein, partial [Nitratireductor sp.]
ESQGRNLDDFPTAARQVGMTPATRVLGVAGRRSGLAESRALALPVGTTVTEIERLRLLDGRAVVRQSSVLPQWVADTLPVDRLMRDSLYDLIRRATGSTLRIGTQHYSAVAASPGQAADLGLEPGACLLRLCRLVVDAEDRPVEYSDSLVRDGYFRFDD